jgi:hypothetical protein
LGLDESPEDVYGVEGESTRNLMKGWKQVDEIEEQD